MGSLFNRIQLLVLLQLIKGLSLPLYHVTVSEGKVIDSLDGLHADLVPLPLGLLVLEDLVCLDKGIDLMCLVFLLELALLVHLLPLVFEQALLILPTPDLVKQLSVLLLMDLINDFAEEVIVVRMVENYTLGEALVLLSVHATGEEGVVEWLIGR